MSKAIELANELEKKKHASYINGKLVDSVVDELRRLAAIEEKYNAIMAQEPVGFISDDGELHKIDQIYFEEDRLIYTLNKDE